MVDSAEHPGPDGSSGGKTDGNGSKTPAGRPTGGSANRNRSRNRNRGGSAAGKQRAGGGGGGGNTNGRTTSSGTQRGGGGRSPRPGQSGGAGREQGHAPERAASPSGSRVAGPGASTPRLAATAVERSGERNEDASVRANRRRAATVCLLPGTVAGVIVGALVAVAGAPLIGGALFVVVTGVISMWLWRASPSAILRSLGARSSDEWDHPRLHNLVDGLCATMGLPRPAICVVDSPVPNAMTVGRTPGCASIVVTSGLDQSLSLVELEGVLAHELVHIKRHDMAVASAAVVAMVPVAAIIGPLKATDRVHSLIGRGREFSADQRAAGVVRYPPGIASALEVMAAEANGSAPWPPGRGRMAALTRWLWIDPMAGAPTGEPCEGNLDDTRVRAAAQSLS